MINYLLKPLVILLDHIIGHIVYGLIIGCLIGRPDLVDLLLRHFAVGSDLLSDLVQLVFGYRSLDIFMYKGDRIPLPGSDGFFNPASALGTPPVNDTLGYLPYDLTVLLTDVAIAYYVGTTLLTVTSVCSPSACPAVCPGNTPSSVPSEVCKTACPCLRYPARSLSGSSR